MIFLPRRRRAAKLGLHMPENTLVMYLGQREPNCEIINYSV